MAKDFGAEALKASIENSSQIVRLEQRVKDLEGEVKRILALLAPKDRKTMTRELALARKRRAVAVATAHRWPKKTTKKRSR